MIGSCLSAVLDGIEATAVYVEADVSNGVPQFSIVGLPDSAVSESKLRIRSAIRNSGFQFPSKRITVNLSPASIRKRGAGLDLAIAIAVLRADCQLPDGHEDGIGFCAELGLSGQLVAVPAIVNLGLALRRQGVRHIVISNGQQQTCMDIPGLAWSTFASLTAVVTALRSSSPSLPTLPSSAFSSVAVDGHLGDFSDIAGLADVKRALTIAAAGRLHTMLVGPPGCGKTMIAERFPSILPLLTTDEALEVYALHQAAGLPNAPSLTPPLRAPHHSLTVTGLIGGSAVIAPGEITLAHRGVLLLDELLEFSRNTLEALREPLGTHHIRLTRNGKATTLPASFTLLATLNPCPCGKRGYRECSCSEAEVARYWSRLSGPLLDRIDIVVYLRPEEDTFGGQHSPRSKTLRDRVKEARTALDAKAEPSSSLKHANHNDFDSSAQLLLKKASATLRITRRGVNSIEQVARTICALEGETVVRDSHVQEALALRGQAKPSSTSRR